MTKNTANTLKSYRKFAFNKQFGLCYYCNKPMWSKDKLSFVSNYNVSSKLANQLQCTAEHLLARKDGGKNTKSNIVAACKYCNQTRHKANNPLPPDKYKLFVQKRLTQNKWLQIPIN